MGHKLDLQKQLYDQKVHGEPIGLVPTFPCTPERMSSEVSPSLDRAVSSHSADQQIGVLGTEHSLHV